MNINSICSDYKDKGLNIYDICKKYHIGKIRLKKILNENGIDIRNKGKQPLKINFLVDDFRKRKYVNDNEYHYIVKDLNTDFVSSDIDNRGGFLTSYIKKQYDIEIPTLYDRRKYYMTTGNYWWEQWLVYEKVENKETKHCPFCDWTTSDLENRSGAFEIHLRNMHHLDKNEYIRRFPNEREYFRLASSINDLQMETDVKKFVTCKICGKKLKKISNRHLILKHNITKEEYIMEYGDDNLMCEETYEKFCGIAKKANITIGEKCGDRFTSAAEKEIIDFITDNGLECKKDRKLLNGKEIDILVPSKNIAIEYNGLFWHGENHGKDKFYHYNKMIECNDKGIKLITIFDDEFISKPEVVLNRISHILHLDNDKDKNRAWGKSCTVDVISDFEASFFVAGNDLEEIFHADVYLGAYLGGDELVGVLSLQRTNDNDDEWQICNFVTNQRYVCCGVCGKLFSYFVKKYNPKRVIVYADRRWTIDINDNIYKRLGFELEETTEPSFYYYDERVFGNRRVLQSYKDYFPDIEFEKVWDCGWLKFAWKSGEN